MPMHFKIMTLVFILFFNYGSHGYEIEKPGMVFVDTNVQFSLDELRKNKLCDNREKYFLSLSGKLKTKIVYELDSPAGYGFDMAAYDTITKPSMNYGALCYSGDSEKCKTLNDLVSKWADANALRYKKSFSGRSYNNNHLASNISIIGIIGGYAISRKIVPLNANRDKKNIKWIKSVVTRGYKPITGQKQSESISHNFVTASRFAMLAESVMTNDNDKFKSVVVDLKKTMKSIREDGSFPFESQRGKRAIFYTNMNMNLFTGILKILNTQNNLNIFFSNEELNKFHKSVSFYLKIISKPEIIFKYAKTNNSPGTGKDYKNQDYSFLKNRTSWMDEYIYMFPRNENSKKIRNLYLQEFQSKLSDLRDDNALFPKMGFQNKCFP